MAGKRSPQSFMKRQRELQKQQEQRKKSERRRERNALKKEAKLNPGAPDVAHLDDAPLGLITGHPRASK